MDKVFIVHYLRRLSHNFKGHHKSYALINAADSIELNGEDSYDSSTTPAELRKIKYVGPFISELVVNLINDELEDEYKLDDSDLLIDNPIFFKKAYQLSDKFSIFRLSELRKKIRKDHKLLNVISDEELEYLNLNRIEDWFDEISSLIEEDMYVAGSARRGLITIKDFDIVSTKSYSELINHLESIDSDDLSVDVINKGKKRVRILITKADGKSIEGDIRLVPEESLASAMLYFTGSSTLNIKMRGIAKSKGMTLNEYGMKIDGELKTFDSEEDIFKFLGMKYLSPIER